MVDGCIVPRSCQLKKPQNTRKRAHGRVWTQFSLRRHPLRNERLTKIVDVSSGFLYLVSHFGVTGAKTAVEDSTVQLIKRVKPFTSRKIPLAVGFGISKPEHVARVMRAGADAAIVGSAFINITQKNAENTATMRGELQATAKALKSATTINKSLKAAGRTEKVLKFD